MDAKEREGVARTLRKLFRIIGRVRLDMEGNRLLPFLAPADLWRTLPDLMCEAAELAEAIGERVFDGVDTRFVRDLASVIERGREPGKVGM